MDIIYKLYKISISKLFLFWKKIFDVFLVFFENNFDKLFVRKILKLLGEKNLKYINMIKKIISYFGYVKY